MIHFLKKSLSVFILHLICLLCAICSAEGNQEISVSENKLFIESSKGYIVGLRKSAIAAYSHLNIYPKNYEPSSAVFGQVTWGVDWVQDIPLFINNPYLLVLTSAAGKVNPLLPFCNVRSVSYSPGKAVVTYKGESARKWFYYIYDYYTDNKGAIRLWFVNAYDAGYQYAYLDPSLSVNVSTDWPLQKDSVVKGIFSGHEFFHVGHLDKNNISPVEPRARIRLKERDKPTIIYIKLWRQRPESKDSKPDMAYVIILEP